MSSPFKRVLVSLILPVILLIAFPAFVILMGGSGDIAFLMTAPRPTVAAIIGIAVVVAFSTFS